MVRSDLRASAVLQEANLTTISNSQCNKIFNEKNIDTTLTENMICAVNPTDSSCHGDSGSPLITLSQNGTYQQIGIVSFGEGQGENHCPLDLPNIFARVTSQLDWIKKMIKR